MKKSITIIWLMVMLCFSSYGQEGPIVGSVMDKETNMPIESASIRSLLTGRTTTTGQNGDFILDQIVQGDSIIISYLGYVEQKVSATDLTHNPVVHLTKDQNYLQEVIINTGYQTLPRERATGSFEVVDMDNIQNIASVNIMENLEGNSSILYDRGGARPPHTIRGLSSINGNNAPLIVLDNFPYEGDINSINPSDIANVTILKDAAASSIWGTRAGNGVIVITTKKGAYNQAPRVSFSSSVQMVNKPNLFNIDQITAGDVVDMESFLFEQGYYRNQEISTSKPALSPVVETLIAHRDGLISPQEASNQLDRLRGLDYRQDYLDHMYQKGINQQYGLTVEGGAQNMTYLLSARLDNNTDNLSADYRKINLRSVNQFRISDRISASVGVAYANSDRMSGKSGYTPVQTRPYYQLLNEEGAPVGRPAYRKTYLDTAGNDLLLDWHNYPYNDGDYVKGTTRINSLITDFSGKVQIIRGLELNVLYRFENESNARETLYQQESFFARDLINSFSQIDRLSGRVTYGIPLGSILDESQTTQRTHNGRLNLSLNRQWEEHSVAAIVGAELRDPEVKGSSGRIYGFDENVYTVSVVDYLNPYLHFVRGSNQYVPSSASRSLLNNRFVSQFANVAYTYKERYVVSSSARRDASNLFGVKTNEKWQPLWSVGARWKLSDEPFFEQDKISSLDLRVTYGTSGTVDQRKSALTTLVYLNPNSITNYPTAAIGQYSNPELRWETTKMLNAGFDFSLAGRRLFGSIEYFIKKGTDLFGLAPIDYSAVPSKGIMRNVADMKGHGVELNLNARVAAGEFLWQPQLMLNYSKNRVTKNHLVSDLAVNNISSGIIISAIEGYPVYAVMTYPWAGLDTEGNPQGYVDGEPSTDYTSIRGLEKETLIYGGSALPLYSGFFNQQFSYKGLSAMVNISYKLGHVFQRESIDYSQLITMNSLNNGTGDYARRWKSPGDELITSVPAFVYPSNINRDDFYRYSATLVESGSHFRLRNIVLSYELDKIARWEKRMNGQVYLNASNLGILWRSNQRGIDPDYHLNQFPQPFSVALGLRLNIN